MGPLTPVEAVKQALIDQGKCTTKADLAMWEAKAAAEFTASLKAGAIALPDDKMAKIVGNAKQHVALRPSDVIELAKLAPRDPVCQRLREGSERAMGRHVYLQVDSVLHALEAAKA